MPAICKRGGSYRLIAYEGYDDTGKQIRRFKTWEIPSGMSAKKAEKEAMKAAVLFERQLQTGMIADAAGVKLCDYAERWFTDYAELQLAPRTVVSYRDSYRRYIAPALGHIYLDKLRPTHLMHLYQSLAKPCVSDKYSCICDFKAYLKAHKLTKKALSEQAGVSIGVLNSITQGKHIAKASAQRIADYFHVSLETLFAPAAAKKQLSGKTILNVHRLLSSMLHTAVQWQLIIQNPCERVQPPKVEQKDGSVFDQEQAVQVLQLLEQEPLCYRTAITVLLFTGLRRGELLGLCWSDIDMKNQTISINKSRLYTPATGIFEGGTKSAASFRTIKVPQAVMNCLHSYQVSQMKECLALGTSWDEDKPLFSHPDGRVWHPDTLSAWFKRFVRRNNLPEDLHLHSLRHTCATLLIDNGIAVTTVAGQLGHSSPAVTMKVYAHALQSAQARAADLMNDILTAPQYKHG